MKGALVIVVLAACGGDDTGGGAGDTAAHDFCLSETNRYRTSNGKPALVRSAELEAYANEGARVDFSSSPHNHFTSTNGGGIAFAENECPQQLGWKLPVDGEIKPVVGMCINAFVSEGPGGGHYENVMGPYTKLGCGIYVSGEGITILQDFGN
ncbi:MAG TPA: CAP domain-containing protein [Kofleriaceae bacterium]